MSQSGRYFGTRPFVFYKVKPIDGKIPKARSGHRIVNDEKGNIYSFGGFNPAIDANDEELTDDQNWRLYYPLFRELWKFSYTKLKWKKLETTGEIPTHMASPCAIYGNGKLIVYGGTGVPFGYTSSNKLYICNLKTLKWQLISVDEESSNKPEELYGQAIAFDPWKPSLYVIGGTTGFRYTINVHRFDFSSIIWKELWKNKYHKAKPEERYRHEIILDDDQIYVFGGGTVYECFGFEEIPVFDLILNDWKFVKTKADSSNGYPNARRCHGCVNLDKNVYIVGGTTGNTICSDLWRLSLSSMQWTLISKTMPLPVYFHSACVSSFGLMTIFGGVTSINPNVRTCEIYSIWLTIPSLKELSWMNFLNHFNLNYFSNQSTEYLLKLGIPLAYVLRLKDQF